MRSKIMKLIIQEEFPGVKIEPNEIGVGIANPMVKVGQKVTLAVAADIGPGKLDHQDILTLHCSVYADNYSYGKVKIGDVTLRINYDPGRQHNTAQTYIDWVPPAEGLWVLYTECDDYAR